MGDESLLITFALYLVILVGVGILCYRLSSTLSDFILAGRRLGAWVVAISAQASDMSGWLLLGFPGEVIRKGMSMVWTAIGCAGGTFFNWSVIARRLRRYSEILEALTIPDFFTARFHGQAEKTIRFASLLVIVIFYSLYIGAQFKAAGLTLSSTFAGLSYHQALVLGAVVIIFYTMMGGFFAVAWTDLFQGMLMVFVMVILPVIGVISLGGVTKVVSALAEKGPELVQVTGGLSGWDLFGMLILGGLAWGLGYPGMPHITVRYMAIKDDRELRKSTLISMVWVVLALWGAMAVGAVGYAQLGGTLEDPEMVLPKMATTFLPGWLAGIVIAAIAAAIMSTVDSQILVLGSAVVEDFYRKVLHRDAPEQLCIILSRAVTLVIGVSAVLICWNSERGVFKFVSDAWSGLAAGFGPALVLSLRWRRTTGWGVAAGMLSGIAAVLVWRNVPTLSGLIWELLPAFLLSTGVIVIVSLLTSSPGPRVEAEFVLAAASEVPLRDGQGNLIPLSEHDLVRNILDRSGLPKAES